MGWGSGVTDFRLELPRYTYAAGETVSGRLLLSTSAPIVCKGLRIRLEHKAVTHWHTGSGDDRKDYHGQKTYAREQHAVWGAVFTTARLDNCGADAVFGSPRAPTDGWVDMPLGALSGSRVALRVMDYDFGQKDDLLGECLLDVDALLAARGNAVTLPLFRKAGLLGGYKQQSDHGQPSVVVLSAVPSPLGGGPDAEWQQGLRRVLIRVHAALHLRSADMLAGNDVYCQLYEVPASTQLGVPLPEPPKTATMPAARALVVPFSFQLPAALPSSIEKVPGVDYGFVRCSVYANIDISWRMDPSCRAFLTIVQPVPASLPRMLLPLAAFASKDVFGLKCCAACCCDCCIACLGTDCCEDKSNPLGNVALEVGLPRAGFAPGETAPLRVRAVNATAKPCTLRVSFHRFFRSRSQGGLVRRAAEQVTVALEWPVPAGSDASVTLPVFVPLLAPDFHGLSMDDEIAFAKQYLPPGAAELGRPDPVTWRTTMRVTLDVPDTPFDITHELPIFICALPLPTMVQPPAPQLMSAPAGAHPPLQPLPPPNDGESDDDSSMFVCVAPGELAEPSAFAGAKAAPALLEPVAAGDAQEDQNCDPSTLSFVPAYFVAVPPVPRLVVSPYAPQAAPVDVSALPPGAIAICPHSGRPFVVPPPPLAPI